MKAIPQLSLLFRDSGRVILLDRIGCVYNLNLRDQECSCGEESGTCSHFAFANKPVSSSRCLICVRDNSDGEALCGLCYALYHQLCVDRRKTYGMKVCLNCGVEWAASALRLCYYCGCQIKGTAAVCSFCPGMDICLACYHTTKHSHQAYVMEDEGLIKTPHGDPLLGYLPLLLQTADELTSSCIACDEAFGSLALLKCGHSMHVDCLAVCIRSRKMNCLACLIPFFRGIHRSITHLARKQPPVLTFRSLDRSILSQVNKSVDSGGREASPAVFPRVMGVSVTPKAGKFQGELETLPLLTPLKMKHFNFSGDGRQLKMKSVLDVPQPLVRPHKEVSRRKRKQSDLSILNLSLNHQEEALFNDWNKLPGRFLSRSKGIKKHSHTKQSPTALVL